MIGTIAGCTPTFHLITSILTSSSLWTRRIGRSVGQFCPLSCDALPTRYSLRRTNNVEMRLIYNIITTSMATSCYLIQVGQQLLSYSRQYRLYITALILLRRCFVQDVLVIETVVVLSSLFFPCDVFSSNFAVVVVLRSVVLSSVDNNYYYSRLHSSFLCNNDTVRQSCHCCVDF